MIKAIVIDDESAAREILSALIRDFCPEIQVVAEASSAKDGIEAIRTHAPQLIFLDINMPQADGFSLLRSFDEIDFEVIFTTAYKEHAIQAIQFSALDYLLKPVNIKKLQDAVKRFLEKRKRKSQDESLYFLPSDFMNLHRQSTKIVLPISKGFKIVEVSDIQFCKADGVYTEIWFANGKKIVVARILKHFEQAFKDFGIIRVHDSYLVNVRYIDQYLSGTSGKLVLESGVEIDISRRRKKEFLELFKTTE